MIQKLKMLFLSISSMFFLAVPLAASGGTALAAVDTQGYACNGANGNLSNATSTNCTEGLSTFDSFVKAALNILSVVVGIAAIIMIIVAGLRYVTSGGKEEGVKNAKNTILYAVIGLVIVALAQIIVHFVLHEATPSTVGT